MPRNPMSWSLWAEHGAAPLHGPIEAKDTPPHQRVAVRIDSGDLLLRFANLDVAKRVGVDPARRLFGLRLRGFTLR
jgi:hypothetical protein